MQVHVSQCHSQIIQFAETIPGLFRDILGVDAIIEHDLFLHGQLSA